MAGRRQEYCQACLQAQHQTGKHRDCNTCEARRPELMPENREAWQLWALASTQWRVSAKGLVGLDYTAVFAIAGVYGIELTPALLRKIKALEIDVLQNHERRQK